MSGRVLVGTWLKAYGTAERPVALRDREAFRGCEEPFNAWVREVCASHAAELHVRCPHCGADLCLYWIEEDPGNFKCPECFKHSGGER